MKKSTDLVQAGSPRRSSKGCLVTALILGAGGGCAVLLIVIVFFGMAMSRLASNSSFHNSYLDTAPPPLASHGTWFNTEGPLALEDLRGKAVWLEFSFLH
ncbi:MAG: hypothetical protein ACC628_16080 [Pirellulaceae bacterium]